MGRDCARWNQDWRELVSRVPLRALLLVVAVLMVTGRPSAALADPSAAGALGRAAAARPVRVAVLSFRDSASSLDRWRPTAEALSEAIPGRTFQVMAMTTAELERAVAEERVDFVLTSTGNYVELESRLGLSRLATLVNSVNGEQQDRFGGLIFTAADRDDIQDLTDLRGRRFLAVREGSLGGFLAAWQQLRAHGIDPAKDLGELAFNGKPDEGVVKRVLSGEYDAGTVRTSVIEGMLDRGALHLSDIRLLGEQHEPGFPFMHSTQLYPEWPFSRLKSTPEELAGRVAVALLGIRPDSAAALAGNYARWAVPHNYQPVHDLMRELRTGPYSQLGEFTLDDVLNRYSRPIGISLVTLAIVLAACLGLAIRGNHLLRREIVERLRIEAERRRLERQVLDSQKLESLGVLTGGIAHDFNNILMAMTGHVGLALRANPDDSTLRQHLLEIDSAVRSAAQLTGQMLAYSGAGPEEIELLDVNRIVQEIAGLLTVSLSKKVTLEFDLAPDLPRFEGDEAQVKQIVLNLIMNASESIGDAEGEVRVVTRHLERGECPPERGAVIALPRSGSFVSLEVSDSGCGMDVSEQKKLFDPFYSTKVNGRGLGLSAVLGIVRGHGGAILLESEPGRGSTFQVLFPKAEADVLGVPRGAAAPSETTADLDDRPCVLFVDDEESLREVGELMLESIGCTSILASDGRMALDLLERRRLLVDCVVLDMTMPRMNGAEALREIRDRWPDLPVVLASGYHEAHMKTLIGAGGAQGILKKPYATEQLRTALHQALGNRVRASVPAAD